MSHALASRARRGAHKITFAATMLQRRQLQGQAWHKPMLRERGRRPVTPRALANVLRCHTAWPSSAAPCLTRASAPQRMPSRATQRGGAHSRAQRSPFRRTFCGRLSAAVFWPRSPPQTAKSSDLQPPDLPPRGLHRKRAHCTQGTGGERGESWDEPRRWVRSPSRKERARGRRCGNAPAALGTLRARMDHSGRQWWIWELRRG